MLHFMFSFVSEKLGGPIDRGQLMNFSWELQISQLKFDIKSNVVPIGMIKFGIHYHRALLFKVNHTYFTRRIMSTYAFKT